MDLNKKSEREILFRTRFQHFIDRSWTCRSIKYSSRFDQTSKSKFAPWTAIQKTAYGSANNNIVYCGYTTDFLPVSQSCIQQHTTDRSLALLSSPAQLCFDSRLIFARFCLAFFIEKSLKNLNYPFSSIT